MAKRKWKHGDVLDIPMEDIEPNPWNPNEMSADEFNMLAENVEDVDFLDPILVVPLPCDKGEKQKFRIVDGEHRWEQQRLDDASTIKCVVADPDRFDEEQQMKQTVRMNKIKGSLNIRKFADLTEQMMKRFGMPYEDLAHEFGFVDENEFESLLERSRDSLPSREMKEEFDKVKEEIKTVDDLSLVLNKLFTKFGDTLPAHFMILDFGGKEHIWVRMNKREHDAMRRRAHACMLKGVTFDSVLVQYLASLDVDSFIDDHLELLEETEESDESRDIDSLVEE